MTDSAPAINNPPGQQPSDVNKYNTYPLNKKSLSLDLCDYDRRNEADNPSPRDAVTWRHFT